MDCLPDVLIFEVGHLCVILGTTDARVWGDRWNIRVRSVFWCIIHNIWMAAITVSWTKVPIQILHRLGKIFQGSWSKIDDTSLWSLHWPLKSVSASSSGPWVLVHVFLPLYHLWLYDCPLILSVDPFRPFPLGDWDSLVLPPPSVFSYSYAVFRDLCSVIFIRALWDRKSFKTFLLLVC